MTLQRSRALFDIAPLLFNWRCDVRHDEYTSHLVGRIRAGRYTSDLWDCNGLYLDYSQRNGRAAFEQFAAPSRYKMTPAEIAAYNADPEVIAERARRAEEQRVLRAEKKAKREAEESKLAAHRRAMEEERQRFAAEYAEKMAKRDAEQKRHDAEWMQREAELKREAEAILKNKWQCVSCRRFPTIKQRSGRYLLRCICGVAAEGSHATMLKMMPPNWRAAA
jgi:hypothetical protein